MKMTIQLPYGIQILPKDRLHLLLKAKSKTAVLSSIELNYINSPRTIMEISKVYFIRPSLGDSTNNYATIEVLYKEDPIEQKDFAIGTCWSDGMNYTLYRRELNV